MTLSTQNEPPALCVEVGLNCESCTASSARELARACPELPGKLVKQLFVQIHAYRACTRMYGNFSRAYAEALEPAVRAMAAAG
jgi:hypothetical protein